MFPFVLRVRHSGARRTIGRIDRDGLLPAPVPKLLASGSAVGGNSPSDVPQRPSRLIRRERLVLLEIGSSWWWVGTWSRELRKNPTGCARTSRWRAAVARTMALPSDRCKSSRRIVRTPASSPYGRRDVLHASPCVLGFQNSARMCQCPTMWRDRSSFAAPPLSPSSTDR